MEKKTTLTQSAISAKALVDYTKQPTQIHTLEAHKKQIFALTTLPDGNFASSSEDNSIKIWDVNTRKCIQTLTGHGDKVLSNFGTNTTISGVQALTVLLDGRLVSLGYDETIKIWDLKTGKCMHSVSLKAKSLAALPDGRLAIGLWNKTIELWDMKANKCEQVLKGHGANGLGLGAINALCALSDGNLASGSVDDTVKIWDVKTGQCIRSLLGKSSHRNGITQISELNGNLASVDGNNCIKIWDLKTGNILGTNDATSESIHGIVALPASIFVFCERNTIVFWNIDTYLKTTITYCIRDITAITVLRDGSIVVSGAENSIKLLQFPPLVLEMQAKSNVSPTAQLPTSTPSTQTEKKLSIAKPLPPSPVIIKAKAIADYAAQAPEELSFQADDELKILKQNEDGWWLAQLRDKKGLVPSNYVELIQTAASVLSNSTASRSSGPKEVSSSPVAAATQPSSILNSPLSSSSSSQMSTLSSAVKKPDATNVSNIQSSSSRSSSSKDASSNSSSAMRPTSQMIDESGQMKINLTIPHKELTYKDFIGQGGFGMVYKGTYQFADVAIKKLAKQKLDAAELAALRHEASVMAKIRNPFVVQLYGICLEEPNYALVMEFLSGGSLYDLLKSKEAITWKIRYQIAIDIGAGMNYLHSQNIIHCDLKSGNVLLDDKQRAKITDFGLSKVKLSSSTTAVGGSSGGSLRWMAPELFVEHPKNNKETDVYAFAMVLWEICARKVPFEETRNEVIPTLLLLHNKRPEMPKETPPKLAELVGKCWDKRAEVRPSMPQAMEVLKAEQPTLKI